MGLLGGDSAEAQRSRDVTGRGHGCRGAITAGGGGGGGGGSGDGEGEGKGADAREVGRRRARVDLGG